MVVDIEKLRDEKNGIEIADNIVCAGVIQALLYATQEVNRCLVFLHGADINAEKLVEEGLRVYGNDNMRFLCRDLKLQGDNMAKMASFILDRTEDLQTDEKETDFYAWAGKHANSHETIVDRIITQITDVLLPET